MTDKKNGQQIIVSIEPYKAKSWCSLCNKWAYSYNPKLLARHQHIGFCIKLKKRGKNMDQVFKLLENSK